MTNQVDKDTQEILDEMKDDGVDTSAEESTEDKESSEKEEVEEKSSEEQSSDDDAEGGVRVTIEEAKDKYRSQAVYGPSL